MIDGIEVLSTTFIDNSIYNLLSILFDVSIIFCMTCILMYSINKHKLYKYLSIIFGILWITFAISLCYNEDKEGTYLYQVTIDKSVSFIEFNNKYEVIEVDGKIYTIREKEK